MDPGHDPDEGPRVPLRRGTCWISRVIVWPRTHVRRAADDVRRATRVRMLPVVILVLGAQLGAATPAVAAPDAAKATAFVHQGIARMINLLKSEQMTRQQIAHRLRDELQSSFDVQIMARFALGALHGGMTQDQERRYLHEFADFMVQTYTERVFNVQPRMSDFLPDDILELTGTTAVGPEQILVHGRINRTGARWLNIDWRIREHADRLRIIDVSIVGISQMHVNRAEFTAVARRLGGIEGLIESMRRKNEELRAN